MRRALDNYYKFCAYLAACSLCLICIIVSLQVVFNIINKLWEVYSGHSLGMLLPSYDSITGYLLVATTFLAIAYTFRQGGHIRVSLLLTRIKSKKITKCIEVFSVFSVLTLMVYASIYSVMLVHETWLFKDVSPGIIPIPLWIPQLVMSFGCITFVVALLDSFVGVITNKHLLDSSNDV